MSTFNVLQFLGLQFVISFFIYLIFYLKFFKKHFSKSITVSFFIVFLLLFGIYGGWLFNVCNKLSYKNYLIFEIISNITFLIFIAIMVGVPLWILKIINKAQKTSRKKTKVQKAWSKSYLLVNIIIISISLILGCLLVPQTLHLSQDLMKRSYITYTGNFEIRYNGGYTYYSIILNEGEIKLSSCFPYILDEGQHFGQITYAKHSKLVLAINGQGTSEN